MRLKSRGDDATQTDAVSQKTRPRKYMRQDYIAREKAREKAREVCFMANITNNTIFDDVFRTMVEKMPELAVPLINEIFGTAYPEDIKIIQKRNEHQTRQGEIITDSQLLISEKIYHLECQSTQDSEMVVRMIEYDFSIGLEAMEKEKGKYRMYLPHSSILYLRGDKEPGKLTVEVVAPEGETWEYKVPAVYVGHYTKEEILEKRLFFLLPFYIMRYEKPENQELKEMLEEYREIEERLEKEFLEKGKEKEYRDLIELIIRIADYILRKQEKARKGFGDVMGGKVLELESDRLIKQGLQRGMQQGRTEVIQVIKLLRQGMTIGETARKLKLPEEEVQQIWEETEG